MATLRSRCGHHIFVLFLSSFFFFPRLISAVTDWMSTILYTWCGGSTNLECRSEICCTRLARNAGLKNDTKDRHLGTIVQLCRAESLQLRHRSTIEKSLLNTNISCACPHNIANFGQLAAEICWRVWGTPANFNRFCILASLLRWRRSQEANQTLHDVWPSPGLVHYIYTFRALAPWRNFGTCKLHFASKSCVLLYW